MGRDRDPFDRTIAHLRARLASWRPLQGAVLSINGLAQALGVSQTPVREALATLAGEGLIVRTAAGYAGLTHDPASLAALYGLSAVLVRQALGGTGPGVAAPAAAPITAPASFEALLEVIVEADADPALRQAHRRVAGQLAPFASAAARVLAEDHDGLERMGRAWALGERRALRAAVEAGHRRRRRAAGAILAAALGLGPGGAGPVRATKARRI